MVQAIAAAEDVLARDANDLDVWRKLGFLYEFTQNHAKAKSSFEAALHIDPQDEMSLKNLGLVAFRTRFVDLGLRSYEDYLKVNKWDATMFAPYVPFSASCVGQPAGRQKVAERGLQLDPTQRELRDLAAKLYKKLDDQPKSRQHLEALREISKRLEFVGSETPRALREKIQTNSQP